MCVYVRWMCVTVSRSPWTNSTYVCKQPNRLHWCMCEFEGVIRFDPVWDRNLTLMHCSKSRWRLCVCVLWISGTVSCWPWTNRRCVSIIGVCMNLKLLMVFDTVWGRNLTLLCSPIKLQWQWRLCAYFRWTVSGLPWTNRKYVCWGVLAFECIIGFDTVWTRK